MGENRGFVNIAKVGVEGSNPFARSSALHVQSGHMGDRLYLRHGSQPRAERGVEGWQGFLFEVEISEVVVEEGDEPDAVIDFLDAEFLATGGR